MAASPGRAGLAIPTLCPPAVVPASSRVRISMRSQQPSNAPWYLGYSGRVVNAGAPICTCTAAPCAAAASSSSSSSPAMATGCLRCGFCLFCGGRFFLFPPPSCWWRCWPWRRRRARARRARQWRRARTARQWRRACPARLWASAPTGSTSPTFAATARPRTRARFGRRLDETRKRRGREAMHQQTHKKKRRWGGLLMCCRSRPGLCHCCSISSRATAAPGLPSASTATAKRRSGTSLLICSSLYFFLFCISLLCLLVHWVSVKYTFFFLHFLRQHFLRLSFFLLLLLLLLLPLPLLPLLFFFSMSSQGGQPGRTKSRRNGAAMPATTCRRAQSMPSFARWRRSTAASRPGCRSRCTATTSRRSRSTPHWPCRCENGAEWVG